jgi:fructose-1-phosphate kinase PfkB-like protein
VILSVDLNPVLRKRIKVPFRKDHPGALTPERIDIFPGGEGIELALMLRIMNEDALVCGISGGYTGKVVRDFLDGSGIEHDFVEIRESTGEQLFIHYSDGQTLISEIRPRLSKDEAAVYLRHFKENLNTCEITCITGTVPNNLPDGMLEEMLIMSRQFGRRSLAALKGRDAAQAVKGSPYLMALDLASLENITHLKLEYDSEIIKACRYLLDKDIEYVFVDLREKGALVLSDEKGYRVDIPSIGREHCNTNYGYLLAGVALGMIRGYDEETIFRLGSAASLIHCFIRSGEVDMSDIKGLMNKLEVRTFRNI